MLFPTMRQLLSEPSYPTPIHTPPPLSPAPSQPKPIFIHFCTPKVRVATTSRWKTASPSERSVTRVARAASKRPFAMSCQRKGLTKSQPEYGQKSEDQDLGAGTEITEEAPHKAQRTPADLGRQPLKQHGGQQVFRPIARYSHDTVPKLWSISSTPSWKATLRNGSLRCTSETGTTTKTFMYTQKNTGIKKYIVTPCQGTNLQIQKLLLSALGSAQPIFLWTSLFNIVS